MMVTVRNIKHDYNDKALTLSTSIISLLNADFDGDQCNIFRIYGLDLGKRFYKALNPRLNMYISRMTGKFENKMLPIKDETAAFWAMNNI